MSLLDHIPYDELCEGVANLLTGAASDGTYAKPRPQRACAGGCGRTTRYKRCADCESRYRSPAWREKHRRSAA